MRNIFNYLDEINQVKKYPVLLLLDFDGTLSPITKSPQETVLSKKTRSLLEKLSRMSNFYIGVISGRKLTDLKQRIGLSGVLYGGNHGLEGDLYGQNFAFNLDKEILQDLELAKQKFNHLSLRYPGAFIEDKKQTFSFHYRLVETKNLSKLKYELNKLLNEFKKTTSLLISKGKKIYDIRPNVEYHKGNFAILALNRIKNLTGKLPATIFIGDDTTDEDVFKTLSQGINIRVGKRISSDAKFYLNSTPDVHRFLKWLSTKNDNDNE